MLRALQKIHVLPKSPAGTCGTLMSRAISNELRLTPDFKVAVHKPESYKFCDTRRTGDLGIDHGVKGTDYLPFHGTSTELDGASDLVKRAFTLAFQPRKETTRARSNAIIDRVKRHRLDRGSPEVKIAAMTSEIHQLLEVYPAHPKNKSMKIFLKEIIDKRAVLLKHLRTWDYKRFEWLLERLNLVYVPYPTAPKVNGVRDAMRVLTDKYCNDMITSKLNAYRDTLDRQKPEFYKQQAETLLLIMEQEAKFGLHKSITQVDVDRALQKSKLARKRLELKPQLIE